jgi:hypothetical protein
MTKYLITTTLINSFQYYINDKFKSPADSRADFLKTLSKEKFEPNEAMQKGIDFENDINLACQGKYQFYDFGCKDEEEKGLNAVLSYEHIVSSLANIVKDGLWQETCKKELKIGNQEFLLYGRMDVIKRDTIYDIKYTSNYELGKFLGSAQHLIYLYCTGLPKFKYLISNGKDFWIEDYFNNINIENEIKSKINDFLSYLENDSEAKNLFETKWKTK